jgi:cellulose synthase/poly-beta-1,6-N-acetylglucosamine synthase-like glycosyltransferase
MADLPVTVVGTLLNEAASLDRLLDSLAAQTRQPEQIILVDGGSSDGTWERLQRWRGPAPLLPLRAAGANISVGRNLAVARATTALVAVTDAGVRLEPDWLAHLLAPFEAADPPDVVGGFFQADPRTTFELALGATTLPLRAEIDPARFLPSSRSVAFRREAWRTVGGYPEWLDYCEDLVFDLALKRAGYRFGWAPDALVHFRPRASLAAFFRQYYRYARGDGKALLWTGRHAVRYGVYSGAAALLWLSRGRPLALALLTLGGLAYCRRPLQRLRPRLAALPPADRATAVALVPLLRLVGDLAKMAGYPAGLLWRVRHRQRLSCRLQHPSATLRAGLGTPDNGPS